MTTCYNIKLEIILFRKIHMKQSRVPRRLPFHPEHSSPRMSECGAEAATKLSTQLSELDPEVSIHRGDQVAGRPLLYLWGHLGHLACCQGLPEDRKCACRLETGPTESQWLRQKAGAGCGSPWQTLSRWKSRAGRMRPSSPPASATTEYPLTHSTSPEGRGPQAGENARKAQLSRAVGCI